MILIYTLGFPNGITTFLTAVLDLDILVTSFDQGWKKRTFVSVRLIITNYIITETEK